MVLPRPKGREMGKVIVMNGVTLDGVMQSPGRPDENTRDGFAHGGWAIPYSDEAMVAKMGERMGADRAFLFGRRTYEELLDVWNARGGPFKDALNEARKYVASSNPASRLEWPAGRAPGHGAGAGARREDRRRQPVLRQHGRDGPARARPGGRARMIES